MLVLLFSMKLLWFLFYGCEVCFGVLLWVFIVFIVQKLFSVVGDELCLVLLIIIMLVLLYWIMCIVVLIEWFEVVYVDIVENDGFFRLVMMFSWFGSMLMMVLGMQKGEIFLFLWNLMVCFLILSRLLMLVLIMVLMCLVLVLVIFRFELCRVMNEVLRL